MNRFENKVILITGGARGQGAEEARQLVAEGARVFITDVLVDDGEKLAATLGPQATFIRHDVTSEADWEAVADKVRAAGGMDGLVNNAGIYDPRPIAETTTESFRKHMEVNQLGCFLGMKIAPEMVGKAGGSIVNISSVAGLKGVRAIAYVGTKWALRGMTKTAALEFGSLGIRVNSVHPGLIDTEMLNVMEREALKARTDALPIARAGTSDDVARLVLFLLSDDSSYITGSEFTVDGGIMAGS